MLGIAFILLALFIQGNNLFLSPQLVDEWENTSVTLTCSYEGQLQGSVHWILTNETKTFTAGMHNLNNSCAVTIGWLSNSDQYSYNCTNRNVFNLTLKRISRQQHGDKLACVFYLGNTPLNTSNTVNIAVKVPVEVAILSPDNSGYPISENSAYSWQCATSHVRPKPSFWWYIENDTITSGDEIVLTSGLYSDTSSDIIKNYTIRSSFKLNRTWNSRYLYCGASNRDNDIIFSQKVVLSITYPPDDSPRIGRQNNGSEVNVIKGRLATLNCTVTTGNPPPRLEWNRHDDQPQTSSGSFVSKIISWLPTGIKEEALICQSIHPDKIEIMFVTINVLYPPENVLINLQNKHGTFVNVTNSISIIEGRPFLLNCSANSKPAVSIYDWCGLIVGNSSDLRVPDGVKRNQMGQLICRVFNIMKLSEPLLTIYGNNSSSLDINVLYSPTVNPLKNWTLIEGDDLVYSCNATPGNPNMSTFTWKRGTKQWDTQQLAFKNVSRNQSGTYFCIVRNLMIQSDGDERYGTDIGEFNLTVQYKAKVRMFVMEDHEATLSVTVNENETVTLACEIEGNPLPDGELFVQHTEYVLTTQFRVTNISEASGVLHLRTTFIAQCVHAGTLTCAGNNTLFTEKEYTTNKTMHLTVNCKPRKSPFHEIRDSMVSPTSVPATINFATLAYPIPPTSGYAWSRNTYSTMQIWIKIENYDTSYTITTSGLQSNLTIKNVSASDFGLYRVTVENDFGSYQHTFKIVAEGKPEAPTQLECIDDLSNETSAALQWMPGFNGGLDQTFFLKLRQINGDTWQEENVADQRLSKMIYTFNGLLSGTSYVFLIYASNKLGNSSSVKITFTTRTPQSSEKGPMSSSSTPVSAVVGGAIAATAVFAILIIVLIFYTKRKVLSSQNTTMPNEYYNMCDVKCYDQHYEQISSVDCKLDKGEHKIYENLRLTRNAETHPARESSRLVEIAAVNEQTQSSA